MQQAPTDTRQLWAQVWWESRAESAHAPFSHPCASTSLQEKPCGAKVD